MLPGQIFELARFAIGMPFICCHIFVILVVMRERRRLPYLKSFLFTACCVQSFMDIQYFLALSVILKFPRVRLVPREFVESLAGTLGFAWFTYCSSFHFVADALMALNRFRAISSTTEMPKPMNLSGTFASLMVMLLVPLPAAIIRLFSVVTMVCPDDGSPCSRLYKVGWSFQAVTIILMAHFTTSSLVTFIWQICTFHRYRCLSEMVRKRRHDDFMLLIYTLLQFVLQSVLAFYAVAVMIFDPKTPFLRFFQEVHSYTSDVMCLSGPLLLLLTSKQMRLSCRAYLAHIIRSNNITDAALFSVPASGPSRAFTK
ncbi:hypothetical protein AAVH_25365 [Aphelenchoides avenae]|nr:hypothetical protein AAVH_25365 [Aphelenchus avenae]